jgi:GNAT superfamily N-acetyltransferase
MTTAIHLIANSTAIPWSVRAATADDRHAIARHAYFHSSEAQTDIDAYANWVAEAIRAERYIGLIAEHAGDQIAGAGIVLIECGPTRGDNSALRARVVNVFTSLVWRRQGVARQLVGGVIDIAEKRGIKTFNLGATEEAVTMYTQLGFAPYKNEMRRLVR